MPLDRLVLIIVIVVAAALATVWLGTLIAASVQAPWLGWAVALPVALVAYVLWRVISDRLHNPEDDHYDDIDR